MIHRKLGASGPDVSAIGLGCMGMSDLYGPADRNESIATIHAALDAGITLLDTGDFYGMGHNEMLIREALAGRNRDGVILSVKFGALRDVAGNWLGYDARPVAVKSFLAYSLRRLGVDSYRHLPPIAARFQRTHRRHDRGDRRHGEGWICSLCGAFGGRCRDHSPRRGGSPDRRFADRVLADLTRHRVARSCRPVASSESELPPMACSPAG